MKQKKVISGKEYEVIATCDAKRNQIKIKAKESQSSTEYEMNVEWNEPLNKDELVNENEQSKIDEEMRQINLQVATIVSNLEMNLARNQLKIKKTVPYQIKEEELLVRESRQLSDMSYEVSAGFKDRQLVFVAQNDLNNVFLELKIKWSMEKRPTEGDAKRLIDKLSTQTIKVTVEGEQHAEQEILALNA